MDFTGHPRAAALVDAARDHFEKLLVVICRPSERLNDGYRNPKVDFWWTLFRNAALYGAVWDQNNPPANPLAEAPDILPAQRDVLLFDPNMVVVKHQISRQGVCFIAQSQRFGEAIGYSEHKAWEAMHDRIMECLS